MSSLKQITANRRNALKSTGPVTPEGKQRSSRNAVRHGLTVETVIATLEDVDDYEAFEAAVIADYDAETAIERELVLRLASVLWRLRRALGIETALFESAMPDTVQCNGRYAGPTLVGGADLSSGGQLRPGAQEHAQNRTIGDVFLALATLPTFPLDRLSRYEHLLWRQARQLVLTLESLRRRNHQRQRSRFPFPFRRFPTNTFA